MTDLSDIFSVRSERLNELRTVIDGWEELKPFLGVAARFSLVLDTNVVLGDILWLVAGRKDPAAKTQLMEVIAAGTLDVYVPPKLLDEMEEKIPLIAAEKGLDKVHMHAEWQAYQEILKIAHPDDEKVQALREGVDPDDADFIALAQTIEADGIFSKDKHIGMMGGNTISIDCIAHLRNYSRSTAVELNIKVNGVTLSIASVAAINALIKGGKLLIERVGAAPDWLRVLLFSGVAYVAFNPNARETVGRYLNVAALQFGQAVPHILSFVVEASKQASVNQAMARSHLEKALIELEGTTAHE